MKSNKRAGIFATVALSAILACSFCVFSPPAAARNPRAAIVDVYDNSYGGEPGEDPHLRIRVTIHDGNGYQGLGDCEVSEGGPTNQSESVGSQGGTKAHGGSRVNLVWRTLLQTWFWTMHR
jgi:hypothetical protein